MRKQNFCFSWYHLIKDYLHKIHTSIMLPVIESHPSTLNKDYYELLGQQHTDVCQEAVCTSATFECADLKWCCFTFSYKDQAVLTSSLKAYFGPFICSFGVFLLATWALARSPGIAVVQLVCYDGKNELRNSAVIEKSRVRAGSLDEISPAWKSFWQTDYLLFLTGFGWSSLLHTQDWEWCTHQDL